MLKTKRTYKKKYVIWRRWYLRFHRELFCENVFEQYDQLASAALQAGKTVSKETGMKAIDVGNTVAIDLVRN